LTILISIEVEALKAEVIEGNDQHVWLQQRLKEAEVDKQETLAAVATAERLLHIQKNSTRSEVFRLKGKFGHPTFEILFTKYKQMN